jgi:putative cell wall-binding protein
MFKKTKVFLIVLGLVMVLSTTVLADTGYTENGGYRYYTSEYDQQSNLEPVEKLSGNAFEDHNAMGDDNPMGYADKDGNIVIPIHSNWTSAEAFDNGTAIIYDSDKKMYSLIDKSGNVVFDFANVPNLDYSNGTAYLQRLKDDPNGMVFAYASGIGSDYGTSGNLTVTFYDKQGNAKSYALPYDKISSFVNGVATLSKITGSDQATGLGAVGESASTYTVYNYTPVASIDTKGVISPIASPIKVNSSERLSGNDRYETAVDISKSGWQQSDNIILTSGETYADALVGTSFAYLKNAPVLITSPDTLDSDVSAEIARLQAKNVYILGCDTTISQKVDNELKEKYNVVRIGGTGLYDTAVNVGNEIRKIKQFDTVIVAPEGDFPDALAIAPFSAMNTMPILFSEKDNLRPDTMTAIQEWGIKNVVIVGGTGVISDTIDSQLKNQGINVTRLAGQDRYDTALEIIKYYAPSQGYKNISIASGEEYPDALTGAVFAAKNKVPLVLVGKDSAKTNISDYINNHTIDNAYIFGGTGAVSDRVIKVEKTSTETTTTPTESNTSSTTDNNTENNNENKTNEPIYIKISDDSPGMTVPPVN